MKRLLLLALSTCCLLAPTSAAQGASGGACAISAATAFAPGGQAYMPFDAPDLIGNIRIELTQHSQGCTPQFAFASTYPQTLAGPNGSELVFRFQDAGGRQIRADGQTSFSLPVSASSANAVEAALYTVIPAGQTVVPGQYGGQYSLDVVSGDERRTVNFALSVTVASQATIQMAGTSGSGGAGMDFGNLETGEQQTALLLVRANGPFDYEISSTNGGKLVHDKITGARGSIDYTAWLDGTLVDLAATAIIASQRPLSSLSDYLARLTVQIGQTEGRMAGTYRDTIQVKVRLY